LLYNRVLHSRMARAEASTDDLLARRRLAIAGVLVAAVAFTVAPPIVALVALLGRAG
jgi:hypothetical protein